MATEDRILLVGLPRSGTTVVANYVNSMKRSFCFLEPHREFQSFGSTDFFDDPKLRRVSGLEYDADAKLPLDRAVRLILRRHDLVAIKETFRGPHYASFDPSLPNESLLRRYVEAGYRLVPIIREPLAVWNSFCRYFPQQERWAADLSAFVLNFQRFCDFAGGADPVIYERFVQEPQLELARVGIASDHLGGRLRARHSRMGDPAAKRAESVMTITRPVRYSPEQREVIEASPIVGLYAAARDRSIGFSGPSAGTHGDTPADASRSRTAVPGPQRRVARSAVRFVWRGARRTLAERLHGGARPRGRATAPLARQPLVSIVTPTFERAELLKHTMASIRQQTYPNVEHIVVDGGSADRTRELLRWSERRYRMRWVSEADEGMYHAINKGLEMAAGDIVAYLNSDDLYFPWTLEAVVRAFDDHPEADFIYGDALAIDDATGETHVNWLLPFDLDYIRRVGFLAQPAVFWRRRAYETLGPFDTRYDFVADCAYWMRAGATCRFRKINELLAIERNHSGTLRESRGERVWPELERLRRTFVRLDGKHHERMVRQHAVRVRFYRRLYTTSLLLQSLIPGALRRGPWSRMLAAGLEFDRTRMALRLMPRVGPRLIRDNVFRPASHWLDQTADDAMAPQAETQTWTGQGERSAAGHES